MGANFRVRHGINDVRGQDWCLICGRFAAVFGCGGRAECFISSDWVHMLMSSLKVSPPPLLNLFKVRSLRRKTKTTNTRSAMHKI